MRFIACIIGTVSLFLSWIVLLAIGIVHFALQTTFAFGWAVVEIWRGR